MLAEVSPSEKLYGCTHFLLKQFSEVFYLHSGLLMIYYSDDDDISNASQALLRPGDSFHVPIGLRHQVVALEDSELFEFSTQHFDSDSKRIIRGD